MVNNSLGNPLLRKAVRLALTGGTIAASLGAAHAQQAPAKAADDQLGEVVVTGSRIAVPNDAAISPVTNVTAVDIEQRGITRVEDLLNELPQVFASQGSNIVNGSDGTATVNLRGLNAKRTLVLVNGDRLNPGDPRTGGAADINMIPTALIDNIEVLTGGASSTYGADAVAGVVNFKLNDHFEGVKLVYDGGLYQHNNNNTQGVQTAISDFNAKNGADFAQAPGSVNPGAQQQMTFMAGVNSADGKGNATFYASYRHVDAILQSDYSISACTLGSGYLPSGRFGCSGSSTSASGRFLQYSAAGNLLSDTTVGAGGALTPFTSADKFNYGPLNYFQRPDDNYTAGSFMHYDFNEHASVYANTMFMDDRTVAQIAPSGNFGQSQTVNCANPYLSASELSTWCGGSTAGNIQNLYILRRNVEGGNRQDDLQHTDFREVLGVKGKINSVWDYDTSFQYSQTNLADTYYNDLSVQKIGYALDVVNVNGTPTCAAKAAGIQQAQSCVPWNIFTPGGVTPAAAAYLATPGVLRGQLKTYIVNSNFTGDLGQYGIQTPWATSGLKINAGAEYRDERSFTIPDNEFQTADLAGQGGATLPVAGGIVSREGFLESRMALVDDKPGAQSLDFETGYRYSSYSLGFNTNTFKFGLDWKPVQDVRIRGSFSRAVRAPNVAELFSTASVGLDGTSDPCAGTNPTYTAAQCARTGVTAAQYGHIIANPAAQYNGFVGGNPNLSPETALTSSFGIGWTPSYIHGFRAQIDYYDIKIENVIQSVGSNTILNQCLQSDLFCNNIHRDNTGSLWLTPQGFVTDNLANVGQLEEKGIDVDISYAFDMGRWGKMRTQLNGTYINTYTITPIAALGSSSFNCAGYYGPSCSSFSSGAGAPVFRWRHQLAATWSTPYSGLDVTATWRYYSPVALEQLSPNPNLQLGGGATIANGGISNTDAYISSYSYLDLTAAMKLPGNVTVRLGVNNIFDKNPPVIGATNLPSISGNGNTMPQVYDALGRYIFGEVMVQF